METADSKVNLTLFTTLIADDGLTGAPTATTFWGTDSKLAELDAAVLAAIDEVVVTAPTADTSTAIKMEVSKSGVLVSGQEEVLTSGTLAFNIVVTDLAAASVAFDDTTKPVSHLVSGIGTSSVNYTTVGATEPVVTYTPDTITTITETTKAVLTITADGLTFTRTFVYLPSVKFILKTVL